jgi:single-stranded-DNA-specific exonuclease
MKWEIFSKSTDDIKTQILINRGIIDPKDQQRFLNPSLDDYSESFILSDLDIAVDRIHDAIAKKEKIIIYGDYDVDGICSSAIMYRGLKNLGADVKPFIPINNNFFFLCNGVMYSIYSNIQI